LLVGGVDGRVEEVDDPALDGLTQSVLPAGVVGDEPDGHPCLGGDGAQGSAGEAVGREEVEAGIADAGAAGEVPSSGLRRFLAVAATLRSVLGSCRCHVLTPAFPKRPCACSCVCQLVRMPARAHACSCLLLRTGSAPSFPANSSMPVRADGICPLGAGAPC